MGNFSCPVSNRSVNVRLSSSALGNISFEDINREGVIEPIVVPMLLLLLLLLLLLGSFPLKHESGSPVVFLLIRANNMDELIALLTEFVDCFVDQCGIAGYSIIPRSHSFYYR